MKFPYINYITICMYVPRRVWCSPSDVNRSCRAVELWGLNWNKRYSRTVAKECVRWKNLPLKAVNDFAKTLRRGSLQKREASKKDETEKRTGIEMGIYMYICVHTYMYVWVTTLPGKWENNLYLDGQRWNCKKGTGCKNWPKNVKSILHFVQRVLLS